jgi:hypothetical protein
VSEALHGVTSGRPPGTSGLILKSRLRIHAVTPRIVTGVDALTFMYSTLVRALVKAILDLLQQLVFGP